MEELVLINNTDSNQYEFHIGEHIPCLEYAFQNDTIVILMHTEVPYVLKGQGIGTKLVEESLRDIDRQGMRVVPLCPFVEDFIYEHPEWQHLTYED